MVVVDNSYLRAINAVGGILQEYDTDKNIPVLGFGAILPYFSAESDCFALNGNIFAPEIHGIGAAVECYKRNIPKIRLHGPTNFASIIKYVGDIAEFYVKNGVQYNYFVLLIITDGQITDMDNTTDQIVRCSSLPVSIVIVGVGNANFSEMDRLDADVNPLYSKLYQKKADRDIVQFVPFKDFASNPAELARQTLAELPRQFIDYMVARNIPPPGPASPPVFQPPGMDSVYNIRRAEFAKRLSAVAPPEKVHTRTNQAWIG